MVTVRSLSRGEALRCSRKSNEDVAEGEIMAISYATDTPIDEIRAWYESTPFGAVQPLAKKIMEISGLDGSLGFTPSEG